ncbi:MAG: hypothetical protein QGD94_06875, partial [Planctomycetia bacterium]|nr:hypothetical protein [Planctomycetia bacterium]
AGPTIKWVESHQQWVDEMKALVNGIEEGKVRGATVRDGYKVDQAIEAIYASARENKTVALTEGGA